MPKSNTWKTKLGGLALCVSLTACGTTQPQHAAVVLEEQGLSFQPYAASYRPMVHIISDNPALENQLTQRLRQSGRILVTENDNLGQYRITLKSSQASPSMMKSKPGLLGRLTVDNVPTAMTVEYELKSLDGNTLTQGEFVGMSEAKQRIYPSLSSNSGGATSVDAMADAVTKIEQSLLSSIKQARDTWRAAVYSRFDNDHVVVGLSPDSGVKAGNGFVSESEPTSVLQLVVFQKDNQGNDWALLKIIEGPLPEPGTLLLPAKIEKHKN